MGKIVLVFFLIVGAVSYSGETEPGAIMFFKPKDKSADTLERVAKIFSATDLPNQLITVITQTKIELVFYSAKWPTNMNKLGTTKITRQIINSYGGIYWEFESSANLELYGILAALPLADLELVTDEPLPEIITLQIIVNGAVISRGNLQIIRDKK